MLNMSFFNGTLNKEKLKEFIKNTSKPIKYTHGLKFRSPSTYLIHVSKEDAIDIVENNGLLDACENKDYLDLNTYSGNDMF